MKAVFDPKGGYFKAGGVYMPSLVAELGSIIEDHLKSIGMIHDPEMSPARKALITEKRHAYEPRPTKNAEVTPSPVSPEEGRGEGALPDNTDDPAEATAVPGAGATFPPSPSLCPKCQIGIAASREKEVQTK